jgi:type I restriction enzyme M protein
MSEVDQQEEVKELFDIAYILKDSDYGLELFDSDERDWLNSRIFEKSGKPYVECYVRDKDILLKPEEIVRQLYARRLVEKYDYPKVRIGFEHPVKFGRETKSADIVVFDKDRPDVEYILVEVKKPKLKEGKDQLRSYCNATGAPIGIWTNGGQISHYHRKDPNYFEELTDIPAAGQTLSEILNERFTWKDLLIKDKVVNEGKSLKTIILDMEDEVLANAGVDVFEEVFKLIFTKLFDEIECRDDKMLVDRELKRKLGRTKSGDYERIREIVRDIEDDDFRVLEFRNTGQSEGELKKKIQGLFNKAKRRWPGVFAEDSLIQLSPSHLSVCVSSLQDVKLFNSNL